MAGRAAGGLVLAAMAACLERLWAGDGLCVVYIYVSIYLSLSLSFSVSLYVSIDV